jgi:DNA-binding CsgD family transcriptional regulator
MQEAARSAAEMQDLLASMTDWQVRCILVLGPDPAGAGREINAIFPDDYHAEARALARSSLYGCEWRRSESPMAAWRNFNSGVDSEEEFWTRPWRARGVVSLVRVDMPTALNNGFEVFALAGRDVRDRADAALLAWTIWAAWPRIRAKVIASAHGISERELEVLKLVATGATAIAAAQQMGCTAHTVTFHLTNIARKLRAPNKTAAVQRACTLGLL